MESKEELCKLVRFIIGELEQEVANPKGEQFAAQLLQKLKYRLSYITDNGLLPVLCDVDYFRIIQKEEYVCRD
jgi:hypothetical protein